jgi:thiol:disulfide interchange protein
MARIENQRAVPIALIAVAALFVIARVVSLWLAPEEAEEPKRSKAGVRWVPVANAQEVARRTGKPILYDFTADWCQPCHLLDDAVFENPKLAAKINDRFVPVRVLDRQREEGRNSPEVQALQSRFAVEGFPTVIFADVDGNVKEKVVGFGGAEAFEQAMERVR